LGESKMTTPALKTRNAGVVILATQPGVSRKKIGHTKIVMRQ